MVIKNLRSERCIYSTPPALERKNGKEKQLDLKSPPSSFSMSRKTCMAPTTGEDPHDFAGEGIRKSSTDSGGCLWAGVPPTGDALSHGKDALGHHGCVGEVDSAPVDQRRCPFYSLPKDRVLHYTELLFSLPSVMVP